MYLRNVNGWKLLQFEAQTLNIKRMINIKDLVEKGGSTVLMVTAADLAEFAQAVYDANQNRPEGEEKLYSPDEFALKNRVTKSTLWRWCKVGILKPTKIGGKVYYKQSDLMEG